jgi:hypothetical protein
MAGPLGTILNVSVTTKAQASSASPPLANLYGMLVHAVPGNTVNVLVYLGSSTTPYFTLTPDASIRLDPAQCPNPGLLYLAAADGATTSGVEILL